MVAPFFLAAFTAATPPAPPMARLISNRWVFKYNVRQMKKMRQELQIIFQDPYASLDPRKSVIEIIAEYMLINKTLPTKKEIFNHAAHLMDVVGLARPLRTLPRALPPGGPRAEGGLSRASGGLSPVRQVIPRIKAAVCNKKSIHPKGWMLFCCIL